MATGPEKEIAIIAITARGVDLARHLKTGFPISHLYLWGKYAPDAASGEYPISPDLKETIARAFVEYRYLLLLMSTGIAIRMLAPLIKDKHEDPGVVVVDQEGIFAVSLLSGHLGRANTLTHQVAEYLGALPVITTASDIYGTISADILGRELGWKIENTQYLTRVSAALVNGEPVGIYQDAGENFQDIIAEVPTNLKVFLDLDELIQSGTKYALLITDRILDSCQSGRLPENTIIYRPRSLVAGIGCNRGIDSRTIEEAVNAVFIDNNLSTQSIRNLATIDLKQDEVGLQEYSIRNNLRVEYFNREQLGTAPVPSPASSGVLRHVGVPSVCEAAAVISSHGQVVVPKTSVNRAVTVAVARIPGGNILRNTRGKLFIIGTGPGDLAHMSFKARESILQSDVVVGYRTYIDLIRPLLVQKKVIATGMGSEVERMKTALDLAGKGKIVSVISSGDAGVYGMAGLMGEILAENPRKEIDIEVVPGIPSLASSAALLGSPLSNDFACISLSDHLIPREDIYKRIRLAAQGDYVIVIYNPRSRRRPDLLDEARNIILSYRKPDTPVGLVTNAFRKGQTVTITDLDAMTGFEINMNTTVIIGNSQTCSINNWMSTFRGYHKKYEVKMP